jgi:hypothetical protein
VNQILLRAEVPFGGLDRSVAIDDGSVAAGNDAGISNPNSWMLLHMRSTAASFLRGLRA